MATQALSTMRFSTVGKYFAHQRVPEPARKVYRVGSPYPYRDVIESLPAAAASLLTAHYRLIHGVVRRFDQYYLTEAILRRGSLDPWAALPGLLESGVPFAGEAPRRAERLPDGPFVPSYLLHATSLQEVQQALVLAGPVLMYLPWSDGAYSASSAAYGEDWVGSGGSRLEQAGWTSKRGVLLKGISFRFNGVRVLDARVGAPLEERWMPFTAIARAFGEGYAKALIPVFAE